jgi:hypothetical protein
MSVLYCQGGKNNGGISTGHLYSIGSIKKTTQALSHFFTYRSTKQAMTYQHASFSLMEVQK